MEKLTYEDALIALCRKAIKESKMNGSTLAKKVGISIGSAYKLIRDPDFKPFAVTVHKVAAYFGITEKDVEAMVRSWD